MQSQINAGLIQSSFSDDRDENWKKLTQLLELAAENGTELVVLPELHNGRYFCQHEDSKEFERAETIPGPASEFLSTLARRLKLVIIGSIFERRAAGLYHNTAVVLDNDGSLAGFYRKMHIPDDPGYHEKYYFAPGDTGFKPVQTSIGKIGVLICWDQWFPEAARLMTLAGAELLVYPTAIGWDPADSEEEQQRQLDSWITIQRAHAISNGIPVLTANRRGHESDPGGKTKGVEFWGNSFICGPQGEILSQVDAGNDCLLQAELDPGHTEKVRQTWPFLRDRRIDAYTGLTRRFIDETVENCHIEDDSTNKGEK
ncbi:MAG: carbon-nitrogen hydrolase [Arenicellales bacterium]